MNLLPRVMKLTLIAILCGIQLPAAAWGPEARKAIAQAAYAILQYDIYEMAKSGDISYEGDLLRGAEDGKGAIEYTLPVNGDQQALEAIEYQMNLLREARDKGMGSHFAYRMGVLSAMIADTMTPYGNAWTDDDLRIQDAMNSYVDRNVYDMKVQIAQHRNQFVTSVEHYVRKHRPGFQSDKVLIRDDFERGIGMNGFASNALPTYFERSIRAIVDMWYTIMSKQAHPRGFTVSDEAITLYFVDEIGYLLNVRANIEYANRAYEVYQRVNPGHVESHLSVGDLYYGFGTRESKEIAVEEWKIVQRMPGKFRSEAARRLSDHYISEGESFLKNAQSPEALESDLPDALRAFQYALEYDRTNAVAARKISETAVAIKRRREEYTLQQKYIDGAALAIQSAEQDRVQQNFGSALSAYGQSLSLLELVDDTFRDLKTTAGERISSVKRDIKDTIREVIDLANEAIEAGDGALLNTEYDPAIQHFRRAKNLVDEIDPDLMTSVDEQTIEGIHGTADRGIGDAELGKSRNTQQTPAEPGVQL